jgi:hypothetical protein
MITFTTQGKLKIVVSSQVQDRYRHPHYARQANKHNQQPNQYRKPELGSSDLKKYNQERDGINMSTNTLSLTSTQALNVGRAILGITKRVKREQRTIPGTRSTLKVWTKSLKQSCASSTRKRVTGLIIQVPFVYMHILRTINRVLNLHEHSLPSFHFVQTTIGN